MQVDPASPVPAYSQVAADLTRRVRAGEFATGPLPSVRALMGEYQTGRDTVIRAIRELEDAGLVFTVPRRGTYVAR